LIEEKYGPRSPTFAPVAAPLVYLLELAAFLIGERQRFGFAGHGEAFGRWGWQVYAHKSEDLSGSAYEQCVALLSEIWDQRRGVERAARFTPAQKRSLLTALAAHLQSSGTRVFEGGELFAALDDLAPLAGVAAADAPALVDEILAHSGLLRRKSRSAYDFVHLSFQEYFAARDFLARGAGDELLAHLGEAWWREVIRLYAAMAPQAPQLLVALRSADLLLAAGCLADSRDPGTSEFAACAEGIVGDLVRQLNGETPARQAAADALAEVGRWRANEALRAAFAAADRPGVALAALLALAHGGDPATLQALLADHGRVLRLLHGELPGAGGGVRTRILALLERLGHPLAYVPAGEFWMGSDDGPGDERPRHRVRLAEYWIDRTPVTNAQYAAFVEASGYRAQSPWRDEFSAGKEQHPVVLVTWDDACAYAIWCGKHLPSEAQWEKAARGSDGRTWPWGNVWDGNRCNVSGRGTTAVGIYPQGVSPYGCHDLAGNVWEWVADWYDAGYYARSPATDPRGPETGVARVLRGGSWNDVGWFVRSADRSRFGPGRLGNGSGFRLALGHQGPAEPAPGAPPSGTDGGQAAFRTIRATGRS
jgi:sulfatase modifying factor 1